MNTANWVGNWSAAMRGQLGRDGLRLLGSIPSPMSN